VSWQQEVFGPMAERTLENVQVRHLVEAYDFSRDSRLARIIVRHVNQVLDADERRRQVQRVRPGELLLRTRRGPLVLPLRTEEDLARVLAGERWESVRRDILARCAARYRELFPEAKPAAVERFLRAVWPGRMPPGQGTDFHGLPRRQRPWGAVRLDGEPLPELDAVRARQRLELGPPRPAHHPETLQKLTHFLTDEAGVPPAVQEPMLLELIALRARCCPRITTLATGQMPVVALHVNAGRSLWQPSRYQPATPIVVTLLADDEARRLRRGLPHCSEARLELAGRRLARVLREAYVQNALLSQPELQWMFLDSMTAISTALEYYQRQHHVVLPCPGTVLDMGRMLTHKALIVRLHLQGLSVLEIARQTYHNPRSVDAYLKAFDAVLILYLYGLTPSLMASVLHCGESLVHEYLELIADYLKDRESMWVYLRSHGVAVPTETAR
jgi:hypothetical protein